MATSSDRVDNSWLNWDNLRFPSARSTGTVVCSSACTTLGDDASTVWLPDVGIHGNGHTMMLERNNEQIADLIEDWIVHHVPDVRGRHSKH